MGRAWPLLLALWLAVGLADEPDNSSGRVPVPKGAAPLGGLSWPRPHPVTSPLPWPPQCWTRRPPHSCQPWGPRAHSHRWFLFPLLTPLKIQMTLAQRGSTARNAFSLLYDFLTSTFFSLACSRTGYGVEYTSIQDAYLSAVVIGTSSGRQPAVSS